MAINRVTITEKYLVFSPGLSIDFCSGVNVLIGGNGTGKTTLMKLMYKTNAETQTLYANVEEDVTNYVYIPEKDILEHAKGLLTFIEQKETGFGELYKNVLVAAQDVPTKTQSAMQKSIAEKISSVIGGHVEWVQGEGTFYTIKTDGTRISFANEASGFKKIGFLGLLIASGQLEKGSVLFWDEPENSLNPEIVPLLVDILLELAESGVQVFISTHDYNFARYFDVRKNRGIPVMFHNFSRADVGDILCISSERYTNIPDNNLERASAKLFNRVVANAMGVEVDG
jgi:ABC-type polar amino acid transport system ATPase subunit